MKLYKWFLLRGLAASACLCAPALLAQARPVTDVDRAESLSSDATNDAGPAGVVPYTRGFNFSLQTVGQHDSSGGWSSIATPVVAFRFDRHWSLTLSTPTFATVDVSADSVTNRKRKVGNVTVTVPVTSTTISRRNFLLGDTTLTGSWAVSPSWFEYSLSVQLGLPTGDDAAGLGAGQVTYAFTNHFERELTGWLTPELELGINDSANLNNLRARKSYTTVGTNAHFEAGFGISLPRDINFETDAYEDLPLTTQTVTATTTNGKKGKQLRTVTTTSEKSLGEDNGFLNTLDVPLGRHVTWSGFYNRSLRNKTDTAGMGFTFLLRGAQRHDSAK